MRAGRAGHTALLILVWAATPGHDVARAAHHSEMAVGFLHPARNPSTLRPEALQRTACSCIPPAMFVAPLQALGAPAGRDASPQIAAAMRLTRRAGGGCLRLASTARGSSQTHGNADEGSGKKVTPLSQWVSEIEKDFDNGLRKEPRDGGDVAAGAGRRDSAGLSLDWTRQAPSAMPPTSATARASPALGSGVDGGAPEAGGLKRAKGARGWSVVRRASGGSGKPQVEAGQWPANVLSDLTVFDSLEALVEALEGFVDGADGLMTAPQAVAAMNHLKRLSNSQRRAKAPGRPPTGAAVMQLSMRTLARAGPSDARETDLGLLDVRLERCMRHHAGVVRKGMYRLTAKHVALALNAVRDRDVMKHSEYRELFRAGAKRVLQLAASTRSSASAASSPLPGRGKGVDEVFDAQNVANIVNAFACTNVRNDELFRRLAGVAVELRPADYTPQAVAIILNAYARAAVFDAALFDYLALTALGMDPALFSAQHVANIANALAKADYKDPVLLKYLSSTAQAIPGRSFSMQAVANILSCYSHFGVRDEALYAYLSRALKEDIQVAGAQPGGGFSSSAAGAAVHTVQAMGAAALGNIIKSLARAQYQDATLFASLSSAVLRMPSSSFDAQAVSDIVSAWVLFHDKKGLDPMSELDQTSALPQSSAVLPQGDGEALLRHMSAVALMLCVKGRGATGESMDKGGGHQLVSSAVLMLPAFGKCLEITGSFRPYGPVRYWLNELFRQFARRLLDVDAEQLTVSDIAALASIFARHGPPYQVSLFTFLSAALCQIPPDILNAQGGAAALATIANAFVRVLPEEEPVFRHIESAVVLMSPTSFDAQALTLMCNAFARHQTQMAHAAAPSRKPLQRATALIPARLRDPTPALQRRRLDGFNNKTGSANVDGAKLRLQVLFSSSVVDDFYITKDARLPETSSDFQTALDVFSDSPTYVAGQSQVQERRDSMFRGVIKSSPVLNAPEAEGPSDDELKAIWDSFAISGDGDGPTGVGQRKGKRVRGIFEFLAEAIMEIPSSGFDAQAQALLVNALVKSLPVSQAAPVLLHLAESILATDISEYDDQNVANIVGAYSRAACPSRKREVGQGSVETRVLAHMAAATVALPPHSIGPQAIANILNGFATACWDQDDVVAHLARVVPKLAKGAFTPGEVSMSLQALAVLHLPDSPLVAFFSRAASLMSADRWSPEESSNLAWSCAVLRLTDKALLLTVCDALGRNIIAMNRDSLRQVHQFFTTCDLDPDLRDAAPKSLSLIQQLDAAKCRQAFVSAASEVKSSQLQRDVAETLRFLNRSLTEEFLEPETGYTVDIKVSPDKGAGHCASCTDSTSKGIAVEVDGPYHFRMRTQRPLGGTVLKRRHLGATGYKLVSVPYWEWDVLKTAADRAEYLRARIPEYTNL